MRNWVMFMVALVAHTAVRESMHQVSVDWTQALANDIAEINFSFQWQDDFVWMESSFGGVEWRNEF